MMSQHTLTHRPRAAALIDSWPSLSVRTRPWHSGLCRETAVETGANTGAETGTRADLLGYPLDDVGGRLSLGLVAVAEHLAEGLERALLTQQQLVSRRARGEGREVARAEDPLGRAAALQPLDNLLCVLSCDGHDSVGSVASWARISQDLFVAAGPENLLCNRSPATHLT